jgi:transcriptional regulator of acetoin/glycerol metabolism
LLDLTADAMDTLLAYDWPGNVRELRTAIEHGVVMATKAKVTLRDLPVAVRQAAPAAGTRVRSFDENASPLDLHATEKRLIMQALAATKGNITLAAKKLGISRRTLHRKINEMKVANENDGGARDRQKDKALQP